MPSKPPTATFTTTLRQSTSKDVMGIEVPPAAVAALGPGKRPKVTVTKKVLNYLVDKNKEFLSQDYS